MESNNFQTYLTKLKAQKKHLFLWIIFAFSFCLLLLFSENLPFKIGRSWLLVPSILFIAISILGVVRLSKRIKFYGDIMDRAAKRPASFEVTKKEAWEKARDFYIHLKVDTTLWEVHLYPPLFDCKACASNSVEGEVYLDDEQKPVMIDTNMGWFFVSAARMTH